MPFPFVLHFYDRQHNEDEEDMSYKLESETELFLIIYFPQLKERDTPEQ